MGVISFLSVSAISRCVADSLAQSTDETDVRLAKLIRRTHEYTPFHRAASLSRVANDWEARVSVAAFQCRARPADAFGD